MPLLIERLCANDQALQTHLDAIKESESLIAIVLAAWQLGLAIATLVVEQELAIRAQQPTQWSKCPKCGTRLHSKGLRSRQIETLVGTVHWKRRVGRCPQGCKGTQVAPLDTTLGITTFQQHSIELVQKGCLLAVFVPFHTATMLLQRITGVQLSPTTIWNWVQSVGQLALRRVATRSRTKDAKLDFWVLFSSMASFTGGLAQADYCAASTFLDAFAHYNFFRREIFTVSMNWDVWQENNLQDELLSSYEPEVLAEFIKLREKDGITSQEGVEALEYVLSSTVPQVVVSPQNLQYRIEHIHDQVINLLQNPDKYRPKSTHQRPNLKTVYVAPSNEVEREITDIYQDLLGIEQVGVNDNFFDLGGNSLIGIQLISRLRQYFQV